MATPSNTFYFADLKIGGKIVPRLEFDVDKLVLSHTTDKGTYKGQRVNAKYLFTEKKASLFYLKTDKCSTRTIYNISKDSEGSGSKDPVDKVSILIPLTAGKVEISDDIKAMDGYETYPLLTSKDPKAKAIISELKKINVPTTESEIYIYNILQAITEKVLAYIEDNSLGNETTTAAARGTEGILTVKSVFGKDKNGKTFCEDLRYSKGLWTNIGVGSFVDNKPVRSIIIHEFDSVKKSKSTINVNSSNIDYITKFKGKSAQMSVIFELNNVYINSSKVIYPKFSTKELYVYDLKSKDETTGSYADEIEDEYSGYSVESPSMESNTIKMNKFTIDDADDDEMPTPKAKTSSNSKPKSSSNAVSESESENEEPKAVKKASKKAPKKIIPSDDEEEEEVIVPKKASKKSKAKIVYDSDVE